MVQIEVCTHFPTHVISDGSVRFNGCNGPDWPFCLVRMVVGLLGLVRLVDVVG